ncbi:Cochaperone protein [Quaeritorhiza haematococci]|nr:Cochaperone protein [Quaeritorhiza haematococci]
MTQDAETFFSQANSAFVDEDFDAALELYNKAIEVDASNPEYFLKRAIANFKLKKYVQSKDDADAAIMLAQGKQETAAKANVRKGLALFELAKYQEARQAFETALKIKPDDTVAPKWIKKCEEKGAKALPTLAQATAPSQPPQPKQPQQAEQQQVGESAPASIPQPASFLPPPKVRHEWFQSENFVTVSVFIKNVKPDTVKIDFGDKSLSLTVKLPTGSDYSMELEPLAHEIVPTESKYAVLGTKIEIKLKKKRLGLKWGTLEGEDDPIVGQIASTTTAEKPTYPSSAKRKPNWDKLEKEVEEEKPEGEQALNSLFQQIYKDANEDVRRAMVKSFVESNGTCLSTNWDEVGKKQVDTTPPDGMIAKYYNK